jgi:hypothetical protein
MDRSMVLLGASPLLAEVNVLAPMAAYQVFFFADHAASRAGFQQVSYDVTGNPAPILEDFVFFPDSFQLALLDHGGLPVVPINVQQSKGQAVNVVAFLLVLA